MDVNSINVKQIRADSLLSQTDFAKELGLSFSTINQWENDKCIPSYKGLKKPQSYCADRNIEFKTHIERD